MLKRIKKEYIIAGVICIVFLLGFVGISSLKLNKSSMSSTRTTPTPLENRPQLPSILDTKKTNQAISILQNKPQLSAQDTAAKQKLAAAADTTEFVYGSPEFSVYYLKHDGTFQVEVNSLDVTRAKNDAASWFVSKGFTLDGLCKIPVIFYLGPAPLQIAQQKNMQFNPLPNNC